MPLKQRAYPSRFVGCRRVDRRVPCLARPVNCFRRFQSVRPLSFIALGHALRMCGVTASTPEAAKPSGLKTRRSTAAANGRPVLYSRRSSRPIISRVLLMQEFRAQLEGVAVPQLLRQAGRS